MPWRAIERDGQWCVYKVGADDRPTGDTLGCHASKAEAQAQVAALYASEKSTAVKVASATDTHMTLAGYGVLYGGEDLEGETFTKETDFWLDRLTPTPPVLYQHGQDAKTSRRVLGKASIDPQDVGLWVEAQIALSDEYAEAIRELAEQGRLGWSSGAVGHLVSREGKRITVWPIAEFSLTPTPAEPRTLGVRELRALAVSEPAVKALLPEDGEEPSAGATKASTPIAVTDRQEETSEMAEETKVAPEPTIDAESIADQVMAALKRKLDAEPAYQKALYEAPEGKDHPETKSFADFLVAIQRGDVRRLNSVYKSTKAALAESGGTTGGYLVPPEYSNSILTLANEMSVVRPRATVIPMASREWNVPVLDYTGSTAGRPPQLGGVVARWTEEAGAKTETEPSFRTVKLVYHELSGYTVASNILRQDAGPTLEAMLRRLFAEAIAWYEDYAYLQGTGAGEPLGVFNSACLVSEAAGANTLVLSDLANMLVHFMNRPNSSGPYAGAVWLAHPTVLSYLVQLLDGAANTNNIIWIQNASDTTPARIFGIPIVYTDKMPVMPAAAAATSIGGLLLADFSYYLIGERGGLEIDFSEHYKFINNQGTWRFCRYVDGQPWLQQKVYRADGTNTCSPFVTLAGA